MNLVECFDNNNMIIQIIKSVSIIDVVRTIYKYCGYQYKLDNTNREIDQYI